MNLLTLFVQLETKGQGQVKSELGSTKSAADDLEKSIAALNAKRRELTKLQRLASQLGGAEASSLGALVQASRRAVAEENHRLGIFGQLEKKLADQVVKQRGLSGIQEKVFRGAVAVNSALGRFGFHLDKLKKAISPFTRAATIGFAALTGTVMGFVTAGLRGTAEANQLSFAMQRISREIAGIFAPTIRAVIQTLHSLADRLHSLTGAQQGMIRRFVEGSAATLGLVMVGGQLISTLGAVTTGVKALALALGVELGVATGGILIAVGALVAGLTFFLTGTETGRRILGQFRAAMSPVIDDALALGSHLMQVADRLLTDFGPALMFFFEGVAVELDLIIGAAEQLIDMLDAVIDRLEQMHLLTPSGGMLGGLANSREAVTPAGGGFESIEASYSRIQTAVAQTDYPKQTATNTTEIADDVHWLRDWLQNHSASGTGAALAQTALRLVF